MRQVIPALPLFGTEIYPKIMSALAALNRPVWLWLDWDKVGAEAPKVNRLQAFLDLPVRVVRTEQDPKAYSVDEIKEHLNAML